MQTEIFALLDGANFAQLASVNADGSPHIDTVWIAHEGGHILVATTLSTRKAINLRNNPAAYLVVTQRDDPYVQAQIKLTCVDLADDDDLTVCDRIAHKYTGRPFPQRHHRGRVVLQLRIDSARYHRARV